MTKVQFTALVFIWYPFYLYFAKDESRQGEIFIAVIIPCLFLAILIVSVPLLLFQFIFSVPSPIFWAVAGLWILLLFWSRRRIKERIRSF